MSKALAALLLLAAAATARDTNTVAMPGNSPLVNLRLVFQTGSAQDPPDKPGLASLTAAMLTGGGTKDMTYKQVLDAMFPMATSVGQQTDQEMTTFFGTVHRDNLDRYYKIFRAMLLEPGWREDDFKRLKDDSINYLRVSLRANNDEELGKEVLYNEIYRGTPFGHNTVGTVSSIEEMTLDDLKNFYRTHYTRHNLSVGIAGGYPKEFLTRLEKDLEALPGGPPPALKLPDPQPIGHNRAVIVEKETRSVAYSIGYPVDVKRGDPDYPALLLAQTYLGHHRTSGGRLYRRLREARGLNYGDYAYIEYFPRGMFQFEPSPNLARHQQIFQIWIRPLEPPTAVFGLRLAMYELDRFVKDGLSEDDFVQTRQFLSKYVNLLTKTKRAEMGYALDSRFYGIPDYNSYIKRALASLTREQVNQAIRKHLRPDRVQIVAVSAHAAELMRKLTSGEPSPMAYNAPKPADILEEDKIVEKWSLGLRPEDVTIVPVAKVFE